jgi:hypothetical protein
MTMQINRTGIFLLLFFGLFGLAMVVAPIPGEAGWILKSIGVIWLAVTIGLILYARRQKGKAAHQDWVFQQGLKGSATVVDASSHATVNELPVMKLTLDLRDPGNGERRVKRREIMSVFAANRIEAGLVLPAYVNPEDPDDFILVW